MSGSIGDRDYFFGKQKRTDFRRRHPDTSDQARGGGAGPDGGLCRTAAGSLATVGLSGTKSHCLRKNLGIWTIIDPLAEGLHVAARYIQGTQWGYHIINLWPTSRRAIDHIHVRLSDPGSQAQ